MSRIDAHNNVSFELNKNLEMKDFIVIPDLRVKFLFAPIIDANMTTETRKVDTDAGDPPQTDSSAPLVFQCSTCSQIVADSFSWVCSHRQLNSITVAGTRLLLCNQCSRHESRDSK
jgi:hypothetical protein